MRKIRNNPFIDAPDTPKKSEELTSLGSYQIDLTNRLRGGQLEDFSSYSSRPALIRNLLLALDDLIESSVDIQDSAIIPSARNSFHALWKYLDQHPDRNIASLNDTRELSTAICSDFRSWLYDGTNNYKETYSRRLWQTFSRLVRHMRDSEAHLNKLIPKDIEASPRGLKNMSYGEVPLEPYGRSEILSIERKCRQAIWACNARIKRGRALADTGKDPRLDCGKKGCNAPSWRQEENILWYVKNVLDQRFLGHKALREGGHGQFRNATSMPTKLIGIRPLSTRQAYASLLPLTEDLIPFVIMLMIKTGLNLDSVISLKRNCIEGKGIANNHERLRYKKGRGSYEEMERQFSNKGMFSPIGLVKSILLLTEPLVEQVTVEEQAQLFIGLNIDHVGKRVKVFGLDKEAKRRNAGNSHDGYISDMCNRTDTSRGLGLFAQWGLLQLDGKGIRYDSRRFRKSYLSRRYEAVGSLGVISQREAKHHSRGASNTTSQHYLNNEANRHLHESAIAAGQTALMEEMLQGQVITNDNLIASDNLSSISNELEESEEFVESLLSGKQDVFLAQCRDFYSSPYSKQGEACGEPWLCFECKNAIWTSRILPRLLLFLEFIEKQRQILPPHDWEAKFKTPWSAIRFGILPRFNQDQIDASQLLAKAEELFIPTYWRTA